MTKFYAVLIAAFVALAFTLMTAPAKPKPLNHGGDRWPLATHSRIT